MGWNHIIQRHFDLDTTMSRLSAKCTLSVNHEFILFMIKKKDFDYRQLCKNDIRNFSTLLDTPICHFIYLDLFRNMI